jgi:rubrerythrin
MTGLEEFTMKTFGSAEEILVFAIQEEEAAAAFYEEMASTVEDPRMRGLLESFAEEERGHRHKLETVNLEKRDDFAPDRIAGMEPEDFVVAENPGIDMAYAQVLKLVMEKEVAAFRLYTRLSEATDDPELRDLLLALAQEEAKHKLSFEVELAELMKREAEGA